MKIGVWFGTFNPPQLAHKRVIQDAILQQLVDEVWLLPSVPPEAYVKQLLEQTLGELPYRFVDYAITQQWVHDTPSLPADHVLLWESTAYDLFRSYIKTHETIQIGIKTDIQHAENFLVIDQPLIPARKLRNLFDWEVLPLQIQDFLIRNQLYEVSPYHKILWNAVSNRCFLHSLRVVESATVLAKRFDLPIQQCKTAALLHDYAKELSDAELYKIIHIAYPHIVKHYSTKTWHGFAAALLIPKEIGITDESILQAIAFHTIGDASMDSIAQCVFIADAIERVRVSETVTSIRKAANRSLAYAVWQKLVYIKKQHSDVATIDAFALTLQKFTPQAVKDLMD